MDYYDPPRPGRPSEDDDPDDADSSPQTMHESHTQSADAKGGFQYIGAELDDMAPVWRVYRDEITAHDKTVTLDEWNKTLDVLLIFAGLFSAVVTTFVVASYPLLQPQNDYAASALYALIQSLNNTAIAPTFPKPPSSSSATPLARWVNGLWFTSLFISLAVALLSILAKQWLEEYVHRMAATEPTATPASSTAAPAAAPVPGPPTAAATVSPGATAADEMVPEAKAPDPTVPRSTQTGAIAAFNNIAAIADPNAVVPIGGPTRSTQTGAIAAFNNIAAVADPNAVVMPIRVRPTIWTAAEGAFHTALAVTKTSSRMLRPPESPSPPATVSMASRTWASRRRFYFGGLHAWRTPGFITQALPLLLHLALFLFLIGLVMFLWTLDRAIAVWLFAMSFLLALLYATCTALPIWWQNCPTSTPLLSQLRELPTAVPIALLELCATIQSFFWSLLRRTQARIRGTSSLPVHADVRSPLRSVTHDIIDALRRLQKSAVLENDWEKDKDVVTEETLKWLILVSSSENAVTVAYQSLGALPLDSELIPTLRDVAKGMTALSSLGSLQTTASAVDIIRAIRSDLVLGRGSWRTPMLGLDVPSKILSVLQQSYYPDAALLTAAMKGENAVVSMRRGIFKWLPLHSPSLPSTARLLLHCQDVHVNLLPYLLLLMDPDPLSKSDYRRILRIRYSDARIPCAFHKTYGRGCGLDCIVLRLAEVSEHCHDTFDYEIIALVISRYMGWTIDKAHLRLRPTDDVFWHKDFLDFLVSPAWISDRVHSRIDVAAMVDYACAHPAGLEPEKTVPYYRGLCNILRICTGAVGVLVVQTLIKVLDNTAVAGDDKLRSQILNVLGETSYPDTELLWAVKQRSDSSDGLDYMRYNAFEWLTAGSRSLTSTASLLLGIESAEGSARLEQVSSHSRSTEDINYVRKIFYLLLFVDFGASSVGLEHAMKVLRIAVPACPLAPLRTDSPHKCDVHCLVSRVAYMVRSMLHHSADRHAAALVTVHLVAATEDESERPAMSDPRVLEFMTHQAPWDRVWENEHVDAEAFVRYTVDASFYRGENIDRYAAALRNLLRVFGRQPAETIGYTTARISDMLEQLLQRETEADGPHWAIGPGIWSDLLDDLIHYFVAQHQTVSTREWSIIPLRLATCMAAAICVLKRRRHNVSHLTEPFLNSVRALLSSTRPFDLMDDLSLSVHLTQHCVELEPAWCDNLNRLKADRTEDEVIFSNRFWLRWVIQLHEDRLDGGPCTKCPGTPPVWETGRPAGRVVIPVFQPPTPSSEEDINWKHTCELPFLGYDPNPSSINARADSEVNQKLARELPYL